MTATKTDDPDYEPIGPTLRSIRKALKFTVTRLSEETGISRTGLDYLERGKRRLDIVEICKIANAMGVEPDELFRALTGPYRANRLMKG